MTKWDDEGFAVPGSYPIATVKLGGENEKGPIAVIQSAVCDICGNWATEVCASHETTRTNDDILNSRISKRVSVVVYACPEHYEEVLAAVCDEYGYASNRYDVDELAQAVDKHSRRSHVGDSN